MILITGATGTVGSAVVDQLAGRAEVRGLVRTPEAADRLRGAGVEAVLGSFEDRASLDRALTGVDRLLLLSPPGVEDMVRAQVAVVDAAQAAGVRHVVKLSSIGADEPTDASIIAAHRRIERHVEAALPAWTHLRPHWFMQNELGQAASIAADGVFSAPDVRRIGAVDARDVAAVAAEVLLAAEGHERRSYVLTGPEALGYADVAGTLSRVLGAPVAWQEVTLDEARESMLAAGLPEVLARGFTEIQARYREGGVTEAVSPAVEDLLGRPPRSFEAFVRDHAEVLRPPVAA